MDWFLYDGDPRHERVKAKQFFGTLFVETRIPPNILHGVFYENSERFLAINFFQETSIIIIYYLLKDPKYTSVP